MSMPQPTFPYRRSADQDCTGPVHHPVVIVGAGPVGLALALDLARRGQRTVVLDRRVELSEGSRAICWSKRTLEIMGRLGVADELVRDGVTWSRGKVFHREAAVFAFDLLPESGHQRPAFINLQQFHFEACCVRACEASGLVDLRFGHEALDFRTGPDGVALDVGTPEGRYTLAADWLVAADGARSGLRRHLGLAFVGQTFDDQFLICDIRDSEPRPTERWFWFDPPFNPGQSALLHRQAGDVWRLDFQIGRDADRDHEMQPENVARRVRQMLGDVAFTFEWISCYRFQCRRLERFRHDRVVFVGDAAHQVSPFGARGGNSGIQDADNLGWKLDLVLRGLAPPSLIDSYDCERRLAADENILNSTRATDFISPKGPGARHFRDAVLALSQTEPFARRLLNSGRLSLPTTYDGSALNGPDGFALGDAPAARPGAAAIDAPAGDGWLLDHLGQTFCLLTVAAPNDKQVPESSQRRTTEIEGVAVTHVAAHSAMARMRYGCENHTGTYLIRPDQHIAARFRQPDEAAVRKAVRRATGRT